MIGRAASYEVRYSDQPITQANFDSATAVSGVPTPGPAGTHERLTLQVPSTAAYVAVRAVDSAGNLGAISSVPIR